MTKKSENHIVHITGDFDKLKSILSIKSIRLLFSIENFYFDGKAVSKAAHPMICFSEYNINNINSETITYGKYGIGFNKEWARKNKISPVLYVGETSTAAKGMKDLLVARRKNNVDALPKRLRLAIMEIKCFIKNETGLNSYNGKPNFDFKSENEWRYVPNKSEINNYLISQNQTTYLKDKKKHNKKLEDFPLNFRLSDLEVVFVSNSSEIQTVIDLFGIKKEIIKLAKWKNE